MSVQKRILHINDIMTRSDLAAKYKMRFMEFMKCHVRKAISPCPSVARFAWILRRKFVSLERLKVQISPGLLGGIARSRTPF